MEDSYELEQWLIIVMAIFAVMGALVVLSYLWALCVGLKRQVLHCPQDSYRKYAKKDSWVVVTGGSDGIGLEICYQMAAAGFNICIVGRNEQKINEKLQVITELNKLVKTRAVIFDFAQKCTMA